MIFHNNNVRQTATAYTTSLIERIKSYVSFVQCFRNFMLFYVLQIHCGAFALSPAKHIYIYAICVSARAPLCVYDSYIVMVFGDLKYSRSPVISLWATWIDVYFTQSNNRSITDSVVYSFIKAFPVLIQHSLFDRIDEPSHMKDTHIHNT